MHITRRAFVDTALGLSGLKSLHAASAEQQLTPDQVHRELVQGNQRFASGHARHPHSSPAWIRRTNRFGQHPHAAVLCCSDSRVAPELVFDEGIGDLFTVRVAGNVANEDEVASLEYAIEHFKVPICVVLGHSNCGAVTAVLEGARLPVETEHLVMHIRESYEQTKQRFPNLTREGLIAATVRANVVRAAEGLLAGPHIFRDRVVRGALRVEGGVYDMATGRVSWIGPIGSGG